MLPANNNLPRMLPLRNVLDATLSRQSFDQLTIRVSSMMYISETCSEQDDETRIDHPIAPA